MTNIKFEQLTYINNSYSTSRVCISQLLLLHENLSTEDLHPSLIEADQFSSKLNRTDILIYLTNTINTNIL